MDSATSTAFTADNLSSSVTVYARWAKISAVTFIAGEGVTGTAPVMGDMAEGDSFSIPSTNLVKENYQFGGWNDGAQTYYAGDNYVMPVTAVNFSAIWNSAKSYTLTFASGEGASGISPNPIIAADGSYVTLPISTFTKTSYKFVGWSDGSNTYNAGERYRLNGTNVAFTAIWVLNVTPTTATKFDFYYNIPLRIAINGKQFTTLTINDDVIPSSDYKINDDYILVDKSALSPYEIPARTDGTITVKLLNNGSVVSSDNIAVTNSADYRQSNLAQLLDEYSSLNLDNYTAASLTASNFEGLMADAKALFTSRSTNYAAYETAQNALNSAMDSLVIDMSALTLGFDAETNTIQGTINGLQYYVNAYDAEKVFPCFDGQTPINYDVFSSLDPSAENKVYVFSNDPAQAVFVGKIINIPLG